jgi:hypothetical protein
MLPDVAAGEKFVALRKNLAEGWKVKWIENFEPSGQFPRGKERYDADDAEPVGEPFARTLPETIRRQRIGFVDGNEIGGILFRFRRGGLLINREKLYSPPGAAVKQRSLSSVVRYRRWHHQVMANGTNLTGTIASCRNA